MYPTVSEAVALPVFTEYGATVVAGLGGLARSVRWVHVAEIADIGHLLGGGELVLTTGISLPDDADGLRRYVADLDDAGAAGLVVELVRRWRTSLPTPLRDAAEERDLPLITVPREVRFVSISEAVISRIVDAQVEELRAAEHVHEVFTALTVACAEPAEVLAHVVRTTGCPVVLENLTHEVLAYDTGEVAPAAVLNDWGERARSVLRRQCTPLGAAPDPGRTSYHAEDGWLVTMVGPRGGDWGRLVLRCGGPPSHRMVVVAERAASALAVQRLVARDRETLERQSHRALLSALLAGTESPATVATRSAALGVPLADRVMVGMAIRPRHGLTDLPAQTLATQEVLRDLAEATALAASEERLRALIGVTDERHVRTLLSLSPRTDVGSALRSFAARIHRAVAATTCRAPVTVAVGSTVTAIVEAARSLDEAVHVAASARGETYLGYHQMQDVRLRGLLHLLRDDERLRAFARRELGPLLEWDDARGTRLVDALRAYCAHGGNKSRAANAAHVSRTAYYQQLSRVQQILGVPLDEPESLLSLHVALVALDQEPLN